MENHDSAYSELLAFLYRAPIALIQLAMNGDVEMMTPCAAALLMPLTDRGELSNLFRLFDPMAPELRQMVEAYSAASGVICDSLQIFLGGEPGNRHDMVLGVNILKIDEKKLMVMLGDVTREVKRTRQEQLQVVQLSSQLEHALAVMAISLLSEDLATGEITLTSPRNEWLVLQYPAAGLTSSQFLSFVHTDDRGMFLVNYRDACAGTTTSFHEFRLRLANGRYAWIAGRRYLELDHEERPIRLITLCMDVTEQRTAERERIALAEHLNLATTAAGVGIFEIFGDRGFGWWNPQTYALHGFPDAKGDTPQQLFARCVTRLDHDSVASWWRRGLAGEEIGSIEYAVTFPDGELHWLACKGQLQRNGEEGADSLIGVVWDITQHRQVQAALEARRVAEASSQAKSTFLANMSHEIRTPMNAIIGLGHLALRTELSSQQHDYMTKLTTAADGLLQLLNDILDLTKIDEGKLTLAEITFPLRSSLQRISSLMEYQAHLKGLELSVTIYPETPDYLVGDFMRLQQVLVNLMTNAIKFTPRGEINMAVRPLPASDGEILLEFMVRDTGIGMNPEQLNAIFEPFVQGDSATSRIYGGTGLGLSICRRLVTLMGGKIAVKSVPGEGSCFTFTACFQRGTAAEVREKPRFDRSRVASLQGHRILVAEDQPVNQQVIREILEQAGMLVTVTNNGKDAVAAIAEGALHYDAVLMDLRMPVMDGYEATRLIRQLPGYCDLPVIALTAHAMGEERSRCHDAGMNDHLAKPIDVTQLMATLSHWLVPLEEGATEQEWTKSSPPDEAGIPVSLPGFDLQTALKRLGGNQPLLLRLVREFAESRVGVMGEIRETLVNDDRETARHLAHALRGCAGNLGADAVVAAAGALEE
jgi:signal transduction histidine kinase/DNA-binding response OmpR family regulator